MSKTFTKIVYFKPFNLNEKHTYFLVSFNDKDDAKCLGAKWDNTLKLWYITNTNKNREYMEIKYPLINWNNCDHCTGTGEFCGDSCWGCDIGRKPSNPVTVLPAFRVRSK